MENGRREEDAVPVPDGKHPFPDADGSSLEALPPGKTIPQKPQGDLATSERLTGAEATGIAEGRNSGSSKGEDVPRGSYANGVDNGFEMEEEVDAEGYRVEERLETETLSRMEEITELRERTELRTREVKEVTMEELKSKETTRPLSLEEFKAILDAELDKNEDVEIGRDIIIEEFSRVESEHEEMSGGLVTMATFSVKEEHKTEEIKEQQLEIPGKEGSVENQFASANREADIVESCNGVSGIGVTSEGEQGVRDAAEDAKTESSDKPEEIGKNSVEREEITHQSEAQKSEETPGTEPAADGKGDVDKGSKSRGIINYIKVKARSLSQDRTHHRRAAAAAESRVTPKEEEPQVKEEGKSTLKKGKQKKWKLFGKKSDEGNESSSEDSDSDEDKGERSSERKKFKLNLFTKKHEDQKEDEEPSKEGDKHTKTKMGLMKKGKEKHEGHQRDSEDNDKTKMPQCEADADTITPPDESKGETTDKDTEEKEKVEGLEVKTKEQKWFHFGKKVDKDSHGQDESLDKSKESPEEGKAAHQHSWHLFGKKTRKEGAGVVKADVTKQTSESSGDAAEATIQQETHGAIEEGEEKEQKSEDYELSPHVIENGASSTQEIKGNELSSERSEGKKENVTPETGQQDDTKDESQKKTTKEHKKFSFGLKFGKKNKKGKEPHVTETKDTADEKQEAGDSAGEIATPSDAITPVDAQTPEVETKDAAEIAGMTEVAISVRVDQNLEGASVAVEAEVEKIDSSEAQECAPEATGNAEFPNGDIDGVHQEGISDQIGKDKTSQAVQQADTCEGAVGVTFAAQNSEAELETQPAIDVVENVNEDNVTNVSKEASQANVSIVVEDTQTEEQGEVQCHVEEVQLEGAPTEEEVEKNEGAASHEIQASHEKLMEEQINDEVETPDKQAILERKESPSEEVPLENDVSEIATEAGGKKEHKSKKFSFGLKVGGKKDGKADEESQKHKGWSPFSKKPSKKDKEVASAEVEKEDETSGQKVPESTTPVPHSDEAGGEKTPEGEKAEAGEQRQSESREGTLKRNKGLHKLFSFGKKSKTCDDISATSPEQPVSSPEAEGDAEAVASEKVLEVNTIAPADKGTPEAVEEEKPRHKKFSFGIKFGKKRGSYDVHNSKPKQTPSKDKDADETQKPDAPEDDVSPSSEPLTQEPVIAAENIEILEPEGQEPCTDEHVGSEEVVNVDSSQNTGNEILQKDHCQDIITGLDSDFNLNTQDEKEVSNTTTETGEAPGHPDRKEEPETILIATAETRALTIKQDVSSSEQEDPSLKFNEEIEKQHAQVSDSHAQPPFSSVEETTHTEKSGADFEAQKRILEFEDMEKLVDDIMSSEFSTNQKKNVIEAGVFETEAAPQTVEGLHPLATQEGHSDDISVSKEEKEAAEKLHETPLLKVEVVSVDQKSEKPIEKVEPQPLVAESKSTSQHTESTKESKHKKPLFGIKFGKKPKHTASEEKETGHKDAEETNKDLEQTAGNEEPPVKLHDDGKPDKVQDVKIVEGLIIEVDVVESKDESRTEEQRHDDEERHSTTPHHHHGIKWPHFGRKSDKKKDEKEDDKKSLEQRDQDVKSAETEAIVSEESAKDTSMASPSVKSSSKKPSHGLGKGLFKIFTPKKQLRFGRDESKTNGAGDPQQEPFVVYSIEPEGQVVAETHWRPKQELVPPEPEVECSSDVAIQGFVPSTEHETLPHGNVSLHNGVEATPAIVNGTADKQEVIQQLVGTSTEEVQPEAGHSLGHFVVVAIDFGTTFSGYAFSFINDPDSIHMMRKWEGGDPGVINQKTPTTILLTPEGNFHSFGFTARDFYHDLDTAETEKWMYFEKFKMALHHNTNLNLETKVVASNGKEFSAMKIFAYSLRFFRDHALKELTSQSSVTIDNDDVRWVITVPTIWKAPAKQFMREAAYQAGIASPLTPDRLLIALEPEAASIYVRKLRMSQLVPERILPLPPHREGSTTPLPPPDHEHPTSDYVGDHLKAGTRYMVVDCGGGTVDTTVHELETAQGCLKELYKATGGPFGSTGVDQQFEQLLCDIFGFDFIDSFKQKRPAGWVDLMIAFESRKRAANPNKDTPLNVSLPFSFIDYYKKQSGTQLDTAIRKYGDKGVSWSMQGMLKLSPEAMYALFRPTLDRIKGAIYDVLYNSSVKDIEYLFLVGGFSESAILQHELRKEFEAKVRIIIPQDVSLTILKGAVCFGIDPTVVTVRQSRMTYGIGVLNRFDPKCHPESKRVEREGVDWCVGIFDPFVKSSQFVTLGNKVVRRYAPAKRDQTKSIIHVYCSEASDVQYVTDDGVQKCATLSLDLVEPTGSVRATETETGRREIETTMIFGDTEIRVAARDVVTGQNVGSTIDFLNK